MIPRGKLQGQRKLNGDIYVYVNSVRNEGSWLTSPDHYFGLVRVVLETFPERRYFLLRFCLCLGTFSNPINTHNNGFSVQDISRSITDFFPHFIVSCGF